MSPVPERAAQWLGSVLGPGARFVEIGVLPNTSHTNHHLLVEARAGTSLEFLLRRYTDAELLASDPWHSPADEVAALRALELADLPVPRLIAEDVSGDLCEVPTLLLTRVPGHAPDTPDDLDSFARRLAEPLSAIHAVDVPSSMRVYEPYFVSDGFAVSDLRPPAWASDVRTWERAFEVAASEPPETPARFIHRDYHHGNTVWERGRLTGVVDWTTGCVGPPAIDLAQARLNPAWDFDPEAADAFLDRWRALEPGLDTHPYWDVLDAVDWLGDGTAPGVTSEKLRRYETFVARALAELG